MSCPSCGKCGVTSHFPCSDCSSASTSDGWGNPVEGWEPVGGKVPSTPVPSWASSRSCDASKVDGWSVGAITVERAADPEDAVELQEPSVSSRWTSSQPVEFAGSPLQNSRWTIDETGEFIDDDWIEEATWDDDEEDEVDFRRPSSQSASSPLLGFGIGVLALVLLAGLWLVKLGPAGSEVVIVPEQSGQAAAATLEGARLLLDSGRLSVKAGDSELAAAQFGAAADKLKEGGAPASEIFASRKSQAQAYMSSRDYLKAHAIWLSLDREVPEWRKETRQALRSANKEIRKLANRDLLAGEAALKAKQFKQAEGLADSALRLFENRQGSRAQIGMASGALGYANLRQGHKSTARQYLEDANKLYPQGGYIVALGGLRPQTQSVVVVEHRVVVDNIEATLDPETLYPVTQGGAPSAPRRPSNILSPPVVVSSESKPKPIPPAASKPKPKPDRIHVDDGLTTYQDRSKK